MARVTHLATLTALGMAPVYQNKAGELIIDTDRLQRHDRGSRTAGDVGDVGLTVGSFEEFIDGLTIGEDDGYEGDDDGYEGDDDDAAGDVDEYGRRRRRRPGRRPGPNKKRLKKLAQAMQRQMVQDDKASYKHFTTVSGNGQSAANIAAGATEAEELTLTPPVNVRLNDLRVIFRPPSPAVAGSDVLFLVTQIRVGDDLVWNDSNGVPVDLFGADNTLRHTLNGRYATPAQPIFIQGRYVNVGSVATATPCSVFASCTAFKRGNQNIGL